MPGPGWARAPSDLAGFALRPVARAGSHLNRLKMAVAMSRVARDRLWPMV